MHSKQKQQRTREKKRKEKGKQNKENKETESGEENRSEKHAPIGYPFLSVSIAHSLAT